MKLRAGFSAACGLLPALRRDTLTRDAAVAGGMPSFGVGVPSPMIRSSDSQHGGQRSQRSSSSPFDRPVPPHLQHKAQASTEERDLDENALAWMAPDFDLDELL